MEPNTTDVIELPGAEPVGAVRQMRARREENFLVLRNGCGGGIMPSQLLRSRENGGKALRSRRRQNRTREG